MNHHESIKKGVVLAATLLIIGSAVSLTISGNNVFAKNTQAASPENPCGNKPLALNIKCENIASQVDGSDNAVNASGLQR